MRFARPEMLWLLALVPALAAWLAWGLVRRTRALRAFAEPVLLERLVQAPGRGLLLAKGALLVTAVTLFVLAAARPQWGATTEQVRRHGVDVLVGIDISESMLAEDLAPSRLRKSQEEVSRLLEKLQGDRVGLMAFAGSAGVLCPLTLDYNALRLFLDELSPTLISHPGTSLSMALAVASQAFDAQQRQHKVVILFSDGEDQIDAAEVERVAQEVASQGLVVHAVGVGTPSGGPIPERGRDGAITGYKKDKDGRVVTSRLDEKMLARVAEITGGTYQPASAAEGEIDRLAEVIAGMDKKEMSARLTTQYEERYQVPLALGLLALVVDTFLTGRRRVRAARRAAAAAALAAVWLLSAVPAGAASVASLVEEGNRLYREGRLAEALQIYQQAEKIEPGNAAVQYNIGNVLYKQEQFDAAYERYRKAFPDARRPLSQGAHYNAGNTHFARRNWPEAIRHYKEALQIDPADMEAKKNLELALRAMEEQRKQQQQQQDQQEQDQQDQNENQQQKPERPQDQREQDAPRPQPREQSQPQHDPQQKLSRQEAMRILDAMKELDRPPKDPLKTPPPDKRPEKDW
jgi:Ca-activated chloride channel family protein